MGQQFVLGIAEFSYSIGAGAFPLFEEIGLKKYIATSSTIPFPIHLHFLGQEHYYSMPGKDLYNSKRVMRVHIQRLLLSFLTIKRPHDSKRLNDYVILF